MGIRNNWGKWGLAKINFRRCCPMGIFGHGISLHNAHPHVCRIAAIQWGRGICGFTHGGLVIISTRVVICRGYQP